MQRSHIVRPAAGFWGLVVFMPVGVNYAALLLLLIALGVAGDWRERVARVRASPLWWPVLAYVAWTLIVLALMPHYPQTPSNLWHGLRIALTILMALALTRDEALWALRAFLAMALLNIVLTALYFTVGLPRLPPWRDVFWLHGNKSISNALLYTVLGATAATWGLMQLLRHRIYLALAGFAITGATLTIVNFNLPSRTSLLALLVALLGACLHQWRGRLKLLVAAVLAISTLAGVVVWREPAVQQKFEQGAREIEAARGGAVSEGSWVVRYYMYTETARMIVEKPLAGWGIGAWNSEWRKRGPPLLADYNMPHNDFLWMGAQAGIPGFVSLLVVLLAAVWQAWRRDDMTGRYAFVATLILLVATSVNSATRDAAIGLSLLWVAMVYLRLASEAGEPWEALVPEKG